MKLTLNPYYSNPYSSPLKEPILIIKAFKGTLIDPFIVTRIIVPLSRSLGQAAGCYYDLDLALNSLALQKCTKPSSEIAASLEFRDGRRYDPALLWFRILGFRASSLRISG